MKFAVNLDSAVVTAGLPDALDIIKAAVANYDLNYGQSIDREFGNAAIPDYWLNTR